MSPSKKTALPDNRDANDRAVEEIMHHLKIWEQMAWNLRILHTILGAIAIICSLLVASRVNSFPSVYIEWLAFSAAAAVGIQTGFDLGSKTNRLREAWRLLNRERLRYEVGQSTIENLIDVYSQGEKIVGSVREDVR